MLENKSSIELHHDPADSAAPTGFWLVIESATSDGSIALLHDGRLVAHAAVPMGGGRADDLTPAVAALLAGARVPVSALAAVVCGAGPGSFTGLRIGAALAKGLVYGHGISLYAVPSALLVPGSDTPAGASRPTPGRYVVSMPALRGESFVTELTVTPGGAVMVTSPVRRIPDELVQERVGADDTLLDIAANSAVRPCAWQAEWLADWRPFGPVAPDDWEPDYGRAAEAQVQWEARHGRPLPAG